MGGAGGEFLPPLEAPEGAGHELTAAAVALQDHMNWRRCDSPRLRMRARRRRKASQRFTYRGGRRAPALRHGGAMIGTPTTWTPAELRAECRAGRWTRPTAGLASGYVQANLMVLPREA